MNPTPEDYNRMMHPMRGWIESAEKWAASDPRPEERVFRVQLQNELKKIYGMLISSEYRFEKMCEQLAEDAEAKAVTP